MHFSRLDNKPLVFDYCMYRLFFHCCTGPATCKSVQLIPRFLLISNYVFSL